MPRVAILSDIHGNLPALESVLAEIAKTNAADDIIFGGDIVGYGASPAKCIQRVRQLGAHCVVGNHEYYVNQILAKSTSEKLSKKNPVEAGLALAIEQLDESETEWISELPWFFPIDDQTVIAHASLHEPEQWHYLRTTEEAQLTLDVMDKRDLNLGFFGHIHTLNCYPNSKSFVTDDFVDISKRTTPTAITVGSVGQPRGSLKDNRATWVVYDSDNQTVQVKRTKYDAKQAAKQIIEAGLPESSARRLL